MRCCGVWFRYHLSHQFAGYNQNQRLSLCMHPSQFVRMSWSVCVALQFICLRRTKRTAAVDPPARIPSTDKLTTQIRNIKRRAAITRQPSCWRTAHRKRLDRPSAIGCEGAATVVYGAKRNPCTVCFVPLFDFPLFLGLHWPNFCQRCRPRVPMRYALLMDNHPHQATSLDPAYRPHVAQSSWPFVSLFELIDCGCLRCPAHLPLRLLSRRDCILRANPNLVWPLRASLD